MDKINFLLGEKKKVEAQVTVEGQSHKFVIASASFRLMLEDVIMQEGTCTIDNVHKTMTVILQPTVIGKHTLEFTYAVADEIIKDKVMVIVT